MELWNLGDVALSRYTNLWTSLLVDFAATQTRYRELSLAVLDRASNIFELALRGLNVLPESGEARTRLAALEAREAEQLANIDAVEKQERELLDKSQILGHELVTASVENKHHEARSVQSTHAVTDAKVKLTNAKEALRLLEGRASEDRSAVRGTIKDGSCVPGYLAPTSAKLQAENGALTVKYDRVKRPSSNIRLVHAAV